METEIKAFPTRCKDFFGLKSGQTTREFVGELRALSQTDRNEIAAMLTAIGLPTEAGIAPVGP